MMPKDKIRFDILGKDFLSVAEAAHYCCVSLSTFTRKVEPQLVVHDFFGKKVYRLDDLRGLMEKAPLWQRSTRGNNRTSSTGETVDASSVAHLVPYPETKLKGGRQRPIGHHPLTQEEIHAINAAERARRRKKHMERQRRLPGAED